MKTLGTKRIDVKKHNRGQILKLIATGTCNNRVELVAHMGMTKMAIASGYHRARLIPLGS